MERSDLAIIIPAFNEEDTISKIVKESLKFGDVIVINDGSTDKTKLIANNSGAIVLDNAKVQGYDKTINRGFDYAFKKEYLYVVTLDADGQHDPKYIPYLIIMKTS